MHGMVDGNVRHNSDQACRHHQPLASDLVGERAEYRKERHRAKQRNRHDNVCLLNVDFQNSLQIEERVELSGVPHDALSRRRAEERNQHPLQVVPLRKRIRERSGGGHTRRLDLRENRRLLHFQPDIQGNGDQDDRGQEGNSPSPIAEGAALPRLLCFS